MAERSCRAELRRSLTTLELAGPAWRAFDWFIKPSTEAKRAVRARLTHRLIRILLIVARHAGDGPRHVKLGADVSRRTAFGDAFLAVGACLALEVPILRG